jgi:hypothetical protein
MSNAVDTPRMGRDMNASNGLLAVLGAAAVLLVVAACDGATTPHEPAIGNTGTDALRAVDDWQLSTEKDVITEAAATHLVKVLRSTADETLRMEIDLTCDTAVGAVSARMKSDAPYVWQESTGDFVTRGFLNAAGIASNPVSTLVQWRVGKVIHEGYIPQGKFNNVAQIDKFFDLKSSDAWSGSLAVAITTQRGPSGVETSIETPNAVTFLKQCKSNFDIAAADKAAKEAPAKAAAKAAAAALHERVDRALRKQAGYTQSEENRALWNAWIAKVAAQIGTPFVASGDRPDHGRICSVLITQTPRGEIVHAKAVHCNSEIDIRILEEGVKNSSPLPPAPEAIYNADFVIELREG